MKSEEDTRIDRALRWRLVLGRHADAHLALGEPGKEGSGDAELAGALGAAPALDKTLEFIYDRERQARSHRSDPGSGTGLSVPVWLNRVRELFPREAAQVLERDALYRYGLTELVTDPAILERAEPTTDLLKAIVQFKHLMNRDVVEVARRRAFEIVERLRADLETDCRPALTGPARPDGSPPVRSFRNVDWHRTLRRNLKNWDPDGQQLVPERLHFRQRARRSSRWHIVISVDQSGSMTDSLVHSAVMAAIFAGLPAVQVSLVLWDHRVVDATPHVNDPLEILMNIQLGGGTDLMQGLEYSAALVTEPERTLFVLLSDFQVWGDRRPMLELAAELTGAGVRAMGLLALDTDGHPAHDERFARDLADRGWFVASLTPRQLAEHVGMVLRS